MLWRYAISVLLVASISSAAPQSSANSPSKLQGLQKCAIDALTPLGQTNFRVQTAANNTWNDARFGAIIKPNHPALIAFAMSVDEIIGLLKCASKTGYQPVARSGRHHFEGWSALNNTLVIDVSQLRQINISADQSSATIGAGTNLGEIYSTLSTIGKTFLGGICPTVALGGYLGVGGYSVNQRQLGMAIDQVLSFKVVTASAELINVSPTENPDLFWAARGGGTFGIVVEATVKILSLPRSAMVSAFFDRASRADVLQKWLDWAPVQPAALTTQFNFYSNRSHLIGWYIGGSIDDVKKAMATSGLMDVPNARIHITGNCSTENSRLFWMDTAAKCTDDATALKKFLHYYNTAPVWLSPMEPPLRFDNQVAIPSKPPAAYWARFTVVSKNYFTLKTKPLSPAVIKEFSDRSGALPDNRDFWAEMTAFGVANSTTTGAFPWLSDANVLIRIELPGGPDPALYVKDRKWLIDFEKWFRPRVGNASYAGYVDSDISINPLLAYYGNNTCRLISVKKMYDPNDVFRNPFSIPTSPTPGLSC